MGCDEFVEADQDGPLSFTFLSPWTATFAHYSTSFATLFNGRVSRLEWSFGDGTVITNAGYFAFHTWNSPGAYTITLTAYNLDHPEGVSSNLSIFVDTRRAPVITSASVVSNYFQFSFQSQTNGSYVVYYFTNLVPPITYQYWKGIFSTGDVTTLQDPVGTNTARFYRVQAY